MIVLISNNNGAEAKRLHEAYPHRIGHLYSPDGWRGNPWPTYALDNGAFTGFDEPAFYRMLFAAEKAKHKPRWVAVPDVVADREATLALWQRWHDKVARFSFPLAFIVQDGMIARDVPSEAAVVFVGGSTSWKQHTAAHWCAAFPRVHIGRVNGERDLRRYHEMGAEKLRRDRVVQGAQTPARWTVVLSGRHGAPGERPPPRPDARPPVCAAP